ncbi:MAG: SLBB domain-containing protein, partial [Spirochaetota bacterium]
SIKINLPFYPGMTLFSILQQLGGPTPFAISDKCVIYRKNPGEEIPFDLNRLWINFDSSNDIYIKPGDYIYIPMQDQFVVVQGEVSTPSLFAYEFKKPLKYYLFLCGGLLQTADKNGIFLVNQQGKKIKKVTIDYEVNPGDIFYVRKNPGTQISDFFNTSLPFLTVIFNLITASISIGNVIYTILTK